MDLLPDSKADLAQKLFGIYFGEYREYVSDDFVSSFDEHSKLPVRINDGTKGQKQIPIDPKQNGE